jgi:Kef-type K+ transport system membrane component KefB
MQAAEGLGLWNRASSVMRQRKKKREFMLFFSFALGTFAFVAFFFLKRLPRSFFRLHGRERESAKKLWLCC